MITFLEIKAFGELRFIFKNGMFGLSCHFMEFQITPDILPHFIFLLGVSFYFQLGTQNASSPIGIIENDFRFWMGRN